jgi:hypothetical protein
MADYKTITEDEREQIFQLVHRVLKARNIVLAKGVKRPVDQLILRCGELCAPVLETIGYYEITDTATEAKDATVI